MMHIGLSKRIALFFLTRFDKSPLAIALFLAMAWGAVIGGQIRRQYENKLGFTEEEIYKNIRRIAFECKLLSENGVVAIAVTISPYRDLRKESRQLIGRFFEVYHKCPLEILRKRDKKGLFQKAEQGEL